MYSTLKVLPLISSLRVPVACCCFYGYASRSFKKIVKGISAELTTVNTFAVVWSLYSRMSLKNRKRYCTF